MNYYIKNNKTGKILSRGFVSKTSASSKAAKLNWLSNYSNYTVVTKEETIKIPQVDNSNRLKNMTCCLCGGSIPKGNTTKGNTTLARDSSGELKPAHFDCITKQFATKAVDYVFGRV